MKLAIKKAVILIAVGFLVAFSSHAQNNPVEKTPPVALKDLTGKTVSLSDYKGKIVLLNFWATWCAPCKAEIPELIKWQNEYQNAGLQIIGITYPPAGRAAVRRFASRMKINYPVLFGSKKTKALFDSGETLPFSVVLDEEGNIRERIEGVIFSEEFDEKIKPLLKFSKKPESN